MNTAERLCRYCRTFISEMQNVQMDTAARLCITEPAYEYCRAFISILQKAYFGAAESPYGYCRKFAYYRMFIGILQSVYVETAEYLCEYYRTFVRKLQNPLCGHFRTLIWILQNVCAQSCVLYTLLIAYLTLPLSKTPYLNLFNRLMLFKLYVSMQECDIECFRLAASRRQDIRTHETLRV
jgi:hypothetical protein